MSTPQRDSVSELLSRLFSHYGQEGRNDSLLRLSNRFLRTFADSQIRKDCE